MNYFESYNEVESRIIFGKPNHSVDLTIVVPTYKRKEKLIEAIESIKNQKRNSSISYQTLIVSNDPLYDITEISDALNEDFVVYRNDENLGMVGNINRCAYLSFGKYVTYLQDDDILLPNFIEEIEKAILDTSINSFDCIIPNRFYLCDKNDTSSIFGRKFIYLARIKSLLQKILSVGTINERYKEVNYIDCSNTWFNCFGGGPTCGITFKRESLLKTNGFNTNFPYAFDFVFFIDFSKMFKVLLLNVDISVYRMEDSASNRPEVQKDFFNGDMYLLESTIEKCKFVRKFKNEIMEFSIKNKSKETQQLISHKEEHIFLPKYYLFRIVRFIRLMRSGFYRREIIIDLKDID